MEVRKWEEPKTDCLVEIFKKLKIQDLLSNIPPVCKPWHKASLDPQCFKTLDLRRFTSGEQMKLVVDRSCGIIEEVFFPEELPFDDFIYICERCLAVKIVYFSRKPILQHFPPNAKDVIPQVVGKWKNLQFLSLNVCFYFKEIIEQVSTHCKNFMELKVCGYVKSEHASAIVTWMPSLTKLNFGMTSNIPPEVLLFILDGCKKLEKVDIRSCYGFDANDGEILEKSAHIKDFNCWGCRVRNRFLEFLELC